jgi:hypothetical protein
MLASWLLLILYGVLGIANVTRGVLAFRVAPVLASAAPSLDLSVLGGIYVGWGVVLLGSGIACFKRASAGWRWVLRGSAIAYQLTIWIIRLMGDRSTYARSLRGRDLALTILFLIVVFVLTALSALRAPAPRHVSRES